LRDLGNIQIQHNFLSWPYREQDAPDKNKKINNKDEGMTRVIPAQPICKKAQQDVGLFYCLKLPFANTAYLDRSI